MACRNSGSCRQVRCRPVVAALKWHRHIVGLRPTVEQQPRGGPPPPLVPAFFAGPKSAPQGDLKSANACATDQLSDRLTNAIIFLQSLRRCGRILQVTSRTRLSVGGLHGDMDQRSAHQYAARLKGQRDQRFSCTPTVAAAGSISGQYHRFQFESDPLSRLCPPYRRRTWSVPGREGAPQRCFRAGIQINVDANHL